MVQAESVQKDSHSLVIECPVVALERSDALFDADGPDPKTFGVTPYDQNYAMSMTFNCIFGTGCFSLPFAFKSAGLGLTSLMLLFGGGLFSALAVNYLLESMARAEGAFSAKGDDMPINRITYRKFDYSALSRRFGGTVFTLLTQFTVGFSSLACLWAYSCVFASSLASLVYSYTPYGDCNVFSHPTAGCQTTYYVSILVFGMIVLVLITMNFGDQAKVQMFLSIYRLVAISVVFITLLIKVITDGEKVAERAAKIGAFNFKNFGLGLGPCLLATSCHFTIPNIIQPLKTKESHCRTATFIPVGISCIILLLLGLLGAIAFDEVRPLVTLNWEGYTGCGNGWEQPCNQTKVLGVIVQLIVQCFPMLNVVSIYPLAGVAIADNLRLMLSESVSGIVEPRKLSFLCRLVVGIPPLIFAASFMKLDVIFSIAGLFDLAKSLSIPFSIEFLGLRYCMKRWNTKDAAMTSFDCIFSNIRCSCILTVLSIAIIFYGCFTLDE